MDNVFPQFSNTFEKGLITDTSKLIQPKGSYTFLLNGLLESEDGDMTSISNKKGNEICIDLPIGYKLLGSQLLDNNDVLLYLKDEINNKDIIAIQDCNCKYKELIKTSCLKFNACYPIDSQFRLKNGCERTIYFTDNLNSIYNINIDSLHDLINGSLDDTSLTNEQKILRANQEDLWDCNKFRLIRDLKIANIKLRSVNDGGGSLKVGVYQFAIRYLDSDLNPSNWFYVSPSVPIYDESIGSSYRTIDGGISSTSTTATGDSALATTNKSISLDISNLDQSYEFYQVAVLESSDNLGDVSNVFIKPREIISQESQTYTFTGIDVTRDISSTENEIVIPRVIIDRAKHIGQKDNRLLLSNLKGKVADWSVFQKKVSQIGSKYVIKDSKKEDIRDYSPKAPKTLFERIGYMRDEIYAFALVFVFKNGFVSPAFHIPGRPQDINPLDCSNIPSSGILTNSSLDKCILLNYTVTQQQLEAAQGSSTFVGDPAGGVGGGTVTVSGIYSSVTVTYNLNGVLRTETTQLIPEQVGAGILEAVCHSFDDDIEIVSVTSYFNDVSGSIDLDSAYIGTSTNSSSIGGDPTIPNATINWDSEQVFVSSNPDTKHIDISLFQGLPSRADVYNTAIKTGSNSGIMAYYDAGINKVYPPVKDCNGDSIWGNDICGTPLEGQRIRHHRFPAASLEPIQDNNGNIRHLGIEFFNISVPDEYKDEIQGYYIVREKRDLINKTILDKGYFDRAVYMSNDSQDISNIELETPNDENAAITYVGLYPEEPFRGLNYRIDDRLDDNENFKGHDNAVVMPRIYSFHSPKSYFNKEFLQGTHIKLESRYQRDGDCHQVINNLPSRLDEDNWTLQVWQFHKNGDNPEAINRKILDATYLDARIGPSSFDGYSVYGTLSVNNSPLEGIINTRVINHLVSNHTYLLSLNDDLETGYWYYGAIKSFRKPYSNLDSLKYIRTHSCIFPSEQTKTNCIFGGDTYISRLQFSLQTFDNDRSYVSLYTESEINSEYRHMGQAPRETYYQGPDINPTNASGLLNWMTRYNADEDYIAFTEQDNEAAREFVYQDYWNINKDFIKLNNENNYFPLSTNFDYCSECIEEFPYRIAYSEQSFQEEKTDNYKAFLANNYSDIMGDQGEITNMFIDRDRLFVHAAKALWEIQTRPNQLITTDATIFVGAGELLSIPPRKLISTDYGYGGSVDKWATKVTEYGTITVDSRMGKVFLLDTQLKEISQNGNRHWFENNLPYVFLNQFKDILGYDYPCKDATNEKAISITTYYDPRFRLAYICKRDFKMTDSMLNSLKRGLIIYDKSSRSFRDQLGDEISFDNADYFENKSWTMSYDLAQQRWVGWFSFLPLKGFNNHDTFFTTSSNNGSIWKHNKGVYQTYYNFKHPLIVEFVSNPEPNTHKTFYNFEYCHTSNLLDIETNKHIYRKNITFDTYYMYTEEDMTSTNTILIRSNPYETISSDKQVSFAKYVEDVYRISKNMRSICTDVTKSKLTSNWEDINSYFNTDNQQNGWIDCIPNEEYRDINKSVYERKRLDGKWISTRLTYKPEENIKLNFQYANMIYTKRDR